MQIKKKLFVINLDLNTIVYQLRELITLDKKHQKPFLLHL